ncbi:hypothetical protein [Botryobacter ruber]|uniref:hypothetical protein n=1 Tax=Botryobacter ruber TaxID=2171629 RepID=UPI000E0A6593|nr:hypothetical protein [Botryobacter ruber]
METSIITYSTLDSYLEQLLDRKVSPAEIGIFVQNQNLLQITRRDIKNASYHITFCNGTNGDLLHEGVLLGDRLQLHSYDGKHRFYSVLLEEQGEEDVYLFLCATVETVFMPDSYIEIVQSVQLLSIEQLIQSYNPIMYSLE